MSETKERWNTIKLTKKALMSLPEGGCIVKLDKKSEKVFFARLFPETEREVLWKKIVEKGHRGSVFLIFDTYEEFLEWGSVSGLTKNILGTVEELYKRIRFIHEIMNTMGKIDGFENRSDLLFLEFEKFVESVFLEIVLFLKKYLGIENSSEFKYTERYRIKVFHEAFEADEEKYKLMINNIALITDFYEKDGAHPIIKEIIGIIQHKYEDKLKPVYKKYRERVLTDYGIPVH